MLKSRSECGGGGIGIAKAITSGFSSTAAQLQLDGTYKTFKLNNSVSIHPSSCLFQKRDGGRENHSSSSSSSDSNKEQLVSHLENDSIHELVFTSREYIVRSLKLKKSGFTKLHHIIIKTSSLW